MELWWMTVKLLATPNLSSTFLGKYQHFFLFASLKSKCLFQTKIWFLVKKPALAKWNFSQLSVRNHTIGLRSSSFSDTDTTTAIVLQCLLSLCVRRRFDVTLQGPDTCHTKQQQQLKKKKKRTTLSSVISLYLWMSSQSSSEWKVLYVNVSLTADATSLSSQLLITECLTIQGCTCSFLLPPH